MSPGRPRVSVGEPSLLGRLLQAAYAMLGALVSAVAALRLVLPGRDPALNRKLADRLGRWSTGSHRPEGPTVWVHASSVGEVSAADPFVRELRRRIEHVRVVVSCQTDTGRLTAERLRMADEVHYFPVDYAPIVRRVVDVVRADAVVFVETEIWPATLRVLAKRGVPTMFVNARVSDRTYPRYRRLAALFAPALAAVDTVAARDEVAAERWRLLGVRPEAVFVAGDIKFDGIGEDEVSGTADPLSSIADGDAVFVAASTHGGEDAIVLEAFESLRWAARDERGGKARPVRLVVVPRHPERAPDVLQLLASHGLSAAVWSDGAPPPGWEALVVDTLGDLRSFYAGAISAFVGGSLVEVGGHNLLEPAAFAVPVVCGPYLADVQEQAELLSGAGALEIVSDADGLAAAWSRNLHDRDGARQAGEAGRATLARHRGASVRSAEALVEVLGLGETDAS